MQTKDKNKTKICLKLQKKNQKKLADLDFLSKCIEGLGNFVMNPSDYKLQRTVEIIEHTLKFQLINVNMPKVKVNINAKVKLNEKNDKLKKDGKKESSLNLNENYDTFNHQTSMPPMPQYTMRCIKQCLKSMCKLILNNSIPNNNNNYGNNYGNNNNNNRIMFEDYCMYGKYKDEIRITAFECLVWLSTCSNYKIRNCVNIIHPHFDTFHLLCDIVNREIIANVKLKMLQIWVHVYKQKISDWNYINTHHDIHQKIGLQFLQF